MLIYFEEGSVINTVLKNKMSFAEEYV